VNRIASVFKMGKVDDKVGRTTMGRCVSSWATYNYQISDCYGTGRENYGYISKYNIFIQMSIF
jgi:hypothetical protein